jgi:hypothetical protein
LAVHNVTFVASPNLERGRLWTPMPTIQQQITAKFLRKLAESNHVDADKIAQLQLLLANTRKMKVDDFVRVFSLPAGGDLK